MEKLMAYTLVLVVIFFLGYILHKHIGNFMAGLITTALVVLTLKILFKNEN